MWLTFLCPGDVIYDVRSHNYILKFAEVEDHHYGHLKCRVKLKIENVDDFGARGQFVKPLTISVSRFSTTQGQCGRRRMAIPPDRWGSPG